MSGVGSDRYSVKMDVVIFVNLTKKGLYHDDVNTVDGKVTWCGQQTRKTDELILTAANVWIVVKRDKSPEWRVLGRATTCSLVTGRTSTSPPKYRLHVTKVLDLSTAAFVKTSTDTKFRWQHAALQAIWGEDLKFKVHGQGIYTHRTRKSRLS